MNLSELVADMTAPSELSHYGKKGMKWGVRHDPGYEGIGDSQKNIAKADARFERDIATLNSGRVPNPAYHNAAVRRINLRLDDVAKNPKYKDIDLTTNKKLKDAYQKDIEKAMVSSFSDAAKEVYSSNASGSKMAVYNPETDRLDIVNRRVEHANVSKTDPTEVSVYLKRDSKGFVKSFEVKPLVTEDSVSHEETAMDVSVLVSDLIGPDGPQDKPSLDELMHFGKKGMKWGVRKEKRLQRVERVAAGRGSFTDNIRVANRELSPVAVVRNKGAQGALERRAAQLKKRKERIEKGEATTKDYLALHGGDFYNFGGKAK